jgi:hypothetical protein
MLSINVTAIMHANCDMHTYDTERRQAAHIKTKINDFYYKTFIPRNLVLDRKLVNTNQSISVFEHFEYGM